MKKEFFLDVCTEYVMLHLAGGKWRARKWDIVASGTASGTAHCSVDAVGTNTESEEEEEDEDSDDDDDGESEDQVASELLSTTEHERHESEEGCAALSPAQASRSQPATTRSPSALQEGLVATTSRKVQVATHIDASATGSAASRTTDSAGGCLEGVPEMEVTATEFLRGRLQQADVEREVPYEAAWRVGDHTAVVVASPAGPRAAVLAVALPWSGHLRVGPPLDTTDTRAVGRWGEALVYQFLLATERGCVVEWVNEVDETRAPYDLIVTDRGGAWARTRYIEVKTTRYSDRNVCELSPAEWAFASREPKVNYDVYRVERAGSSGCTIRVVRDLLQQVTERKVRLCIAI